MAFCLGSSSAAVVSLCAFFPRDYKAMDSRGKQLKAALENAQFNEKAEKFESAIEELLKEVGVVVSPVFLSG